MFDVDDAGNRNCTVITRVLDFEDIKDDLVRKVENSRFDNCLGIAASPRNSGNKGQASLQNE